MRYSREMRKMIYFEAYGFNPVTYGNRSYVSCHGLVLSSFRPVEVLVPYDLYSELRRARVKKYVVLKSSSNKRVIVSADDRVINIYDRKKLQRYTGKHATVPERVVMRLQTMFTKTDRMFFIDWIEVPSFLSGDRLLILLAIYYVGSGLGMKMFHLDHQDAEKLVRELRYIEGLLVDHGEVLVYVPKPVPYIHYNDVRRALVSLKHISATETPIPVEGLETEAEEEMADEGYSEEVS